MQLLCTCKLEVEIAAQGEACYLAQPSSGVLTAWEQQCHIGRGEQESNIFAVLAQVIPRILNKCAYKKHVSRIVFF